MLLRLGRLEGLFAPAWPDGLPADFSLEREAERWGHLLAPVLAVLDEGVGEQLLDVAEVHFDRLCLMARREWPCGGDPPARFIADTRRLPAAVALVIARLPRESRPVLVRAVAANDSPARDPVAWRVGCWFWEIASVRGRLAPDVSEQVVGAVLAEVIALATAPNVFHRSCGNCGLHRPARVEAAPARCEHCGSSSSSWTHLDEAAGWRALATAELDPDCPERS
jgi:hypothetical protein